jgi:signal peptidase I
MTATLAAPKRSRLRRALAIIEGFLAIVGLFFLVYHSCFRIYYVTTSSMNPTLNGAENGEGDWVLINKLTYHLRKPIRWEVAALRLPDGGLVAKRVVALPNEEVSIQDRQVCIDGVPQTPPPSLRFLSYLAVGKVKEGRSFRCGAQHYFVLGDDSRDSQDSRFEGDIGMGRFEGGVLLRIWPPNRIGLVNP